MKREIIATVLANRLLDAGGPVFLLRLREASGADNAACVRAFEIARAGLDMAGHGERIRAASAKVSAGGRLALDLALNETVGKVAVHLLRRDAGGDVAELVGLYADGFSALGKTAVKRASTYEVSRYERGIKTLVKAGASEALAKQVEKAKLLARAVQVIDIAEESGVSLDETMSIFSEIGGAFRIDRLRAGMQDAGDGMTQWEKMAAYVQLNNLLAVQKEATQQILADGADVGAFLKTRSGQIDALGQQIRSMGLAREWSFAKFALATDMVRAALS